MKGAASGAEVFAALLHLGASHPDSQCLNFTDMEIRNQQLSGVGHGWSYMACTEVIHPIGANNKTDMFPPYDWNIEGLTASCKQGWHVYPDASYLPNKIGFRFSGFGSKARVKKSKELPGRVLLTYGDHDPWGTMVPRQGWADDVEVVKVPGGAHCSDLETRRPEDTKPMLEARKKIATVLSQWIGEVQKMRVMKINDFGHNVTQPTGLRKFGSTLRGSKALAP